VTRPFRFGVTLQPVSGGRAAWLDAVRSAEQCGFGVVTVMDHFRSGGIWSSLTAAHDAAPSLRLGTLVLNSDLAHPMLVAREAITADILTNGKIELGVGAGWDREDYRVIGKARPPVSVRIERLAEALTILSQACRRERPVFSGSHYAAEAPVDWPAPKQERIPLLIGGGGKQVLELAAARGDIVSISRNLQQGMQGSWRQTAIGRDGGPDRMDERLSWIRAAAGARFEELELQAIVGSLVLTDDRISAAGKAGAGYGLSATEVLDSPHFLIGTVEQTAADLERRRERWGISYWTLSSGNVEGGNNMQDFARLILRLAG